MIVPIFGSNKRTAFQIYKFWLQSNGKNIANPDVLAWYASYVAEVRHIRKALLDQDGTWRAFATWKWEHVGEKDYDNVEGSAFAYLLGTVEFELLHAMVKQGKKYGLGYEALSMTVAMRVKVTLCVLKLFTGYWTRWILGMAYQPRFVYRQCLQRIE